jgi:hypothetical protein
MGQTTSIRSVKDVRLGSSRTFVIHGLDHKEAETGIIFPINDAGIIAESALCCAAVDATAYGAKPPLGAVIPECHLPVVEWKAGISNVNGEPILILTVSGRNLLKFQFPAQTARECGAELLRLGTAAGESPSRAN